MADFSYVQHYYGVPACLGRQVIVGGKPGLIAQDRGHYIGVNFDHDKPGVVRSCHPTSDVVYGDIGRLRPMSASQRRYQEYLKVADCFESFRGWLLYSTQRRRQERLCSQ